MLRMSLTIIYGNLQQAITLFEKPVRHLINMVELKILITNKAFCSQAVNF